MEMNTVIQKLSTMIFDNSLEQPRSIKDLKTELGSADSQVKAMKTIVSMIQQNYDMGVLYSDVLRIIDTPNPELKILCNVYLKSTCADRPACQLMCTHTFLKDFNDRNWVIQRSAVNDAVQLSDEIIIKNYSNDIKRMCAHERKEVRMAAARCISLFYLKNKDMFFHEHLTKYLKGLLGDCEDEVAVAAAKSISLIESKENIVSVRDVCKITNTFIEKRNYQGIRAALGIIKYKRITEQTRSILLKLLHSSDICIFYLSSMKLLESDRSLYQKVYDTAKSFVSVRPEQLYNLLTYVDSFFDRVDSNSKDFVILDGDPSYIKDMKIKLLIRKYDGFSRSEVERLIKRKERILKILEYALEYNIMVDGLLNHIVPDQHDQALKILHRYSQLASTKVLKTTADPANTWSTMIGEYLNSIKYGMGEAHMYIELCGIFCNLIPSLIFKLENESNSIHMLKFYCLMMNRRIINEHQCLNYLKNLRKAVPHMPRIKLVIKNIGRIDSEDVYGGLSFLAGTSSGKAIGGVEVDFPIEKDYEDEILCDRPFQIYGCKSEETKDQRTGEMHCTSHESLHTYIDKKHIESKHSKSMQDISYVPRKSTLPGENRITVESMPVYIDTNTFKGTLDIIDSKMVLTVDILEENQKVRYGLHVAGRPCDNALEHCSEIANEGKYVLFEIEDIHLGGIFKFKIEHTVFEVGINIYKMIRPLRCDLRTFESYFSQTGESIDLETFKTDNSFEVSESCYAFKVFDQKVFAKKFENSVTLKGKPEILEKFK